MAPIEHAATAQAESAIRETIQSLYNVMLHTANYDATGPHTTLDALVREVGVLAHALRDVSIATDESSASAASAASAAAKLPSVPRDLVQYVEDGRNPDIYTREFVELVRKTNQLRAGKQASFAQFQAVLAGHIRSALPELSGDVDRVVAATGGAANAAQATATAAADAADAADAASAGAAASGGAADASAATAQPSRASVPAATRASDSASSRDGTPGVLTPGGGTPGPGAAGPGGVGAAAAGLGAAAAAVDMMGILPSTPQPGVAGAGGAAASGAAAAGATPSNQDTQMS